MNGAEQAALAIRLDQALAREGLRVVRGVTRGGNVVAWEPVPAEMILGTLMAARWRIEEVPSSVGRVLTLEPAQ